MTGTFVFVVCGKKEHIRTLHFSLRYLKMFSENEIIVLTDSSRNEEPVVHTNIVDVATPKELSHHQASIYLKVGIYKHVPKGRMYCYLDTDVIAISTDVDKVFDEFIAPIRFAKDDCKVNSFSAHAVNCDCLKDLIEPREILQQALDPYLIRTPGQMEKRARLNREFDRLRNDRWYKLKCDIRSTFSGRIFRLNNEFNLDKKTGIWYDSQGEEVMQSVDFDKVALQTGFTYVDSRSTWIDGSGRDLWSDDCDHLIEQIALKWNIKVEQRDWQHWNGGVFLFNDSSHKFLEAWFNKTMQIFEDPGWRTRDQGTLIATAWEHNLQHTEVLNSKWNFLADFNNPDMALNPDTGSFTDNAFQTSCKPALVHVYHHFGDTDWYLWNWIVEIPENHKT